MSPRRTAAAPTLGRTGRVVVAGGGPAACAAVEELRARGFTGSITVLCGESVGPYDRTACSKGLIDGHQRPADAMLAMPPGAHWRLGERAVCVDPADRTVTGSSGTAYPYDGLIIATGTTTSIPVGWPADEPGILQLRTLNDAWAIRKALRGADRVAIIGGGFTGCELACGVVQTARSPVIIDGYRTLLHEAVGPKLGALVSTEHREAGIDVLLDRSVVGVGRRRGRFQLQLDTAEQIDADLVVLATGQRPDTDWLSGAGFDLTDGVLCDEALRVVGGDGTIVAAGAVARWSNSWYGGNPSRCGQWVSAMEQGCAAARTLLAGDADVAPVTLVPRYASLQYRLRIQVAGRPDLGDDVRLTRLRPGRHSPASSGVVATYHRNDQLMGVAAVNAPAPFSTALRELLASPPPPILSAPVARHRQPEPEQDESADASDSTESVEPDDVRASVFATVF